MNLRGRTRDHIELLLANESRAELLDRIFSLVTVEQLLKPSEIAARSCVNKRAVVHDIRDGKFGDYFVRAETPFRCRSAESFAWRDRFRVFRKL